MARRGPRENWETYADRLIREAGERGEFDDLPGKDKPLRSLDASPDDLWWVRDWMRREGLSITPPALALKKAREDLIDGLAEVPTEADLRQAVEELNTRIRHLNRIPTNGPPSSLWPIDLDTIVAAWHEARRTAHADPERGVQPVPGLDGDERP